MAAFFRFFVIVFTLMRYRIDLLLPNKTLPFWLKFFLFPLTIGTKSDINRGIKLRKSLEDLGPIFVKFGQLLSTRPDLIPADIIVELSKLQDNVPPFDDSVFKNIVETSLGADVQTIFKAFESTPLASASVAQVHAATLHDDRAVVIKVIRPNIREVIETDIQLLHLFARLFERYSSEGRRLHPIDIVNDYRTTILDELDLQHEAANASQLRRNFADSDMLYIPEVIWEHTRNNVYVMERISGIPVSDINALNAHNIDIKRLAERGVEIFFTQVFEHNFFHADMHPGNIFVSCENPASPQYICVDMAIVGALSREDQYYLARNMLAMFRRDYRQVAELHVQSGWVPENIKIAELEAAVRTVCEPIFEKPLKEISFGVVLINLFRTAQRFNMEIQPQLVLLQKTLLNIEGLGRQLYPDLDLWATAHPFLERWLKLRLHPRSLLNEFKRYGPEWLEKFPQVPQLIFNGLTQIQNLDKMVAAVELNSQQRVIQMARHKKNKRRVTISLIALSGAVAIAYEPLKQIIQHVDWQQIPATAGILVVVAMAAWLTR